MIGSKTILGIAIVLVMGGATLAGVVMAEGEEFDPVYAPQWQAGYSFTYDATAAITATTRGVEDWGVPDNTDLVVGPISITKDVLSTTYIDSDGQPVYVSSASFPLSNLQGGMDIFGSAPAFATAERQSDLAPIPVLPDFSCRSNDCESGGLNFFHSNPMTYLSFPLSQDKRWEQEVDLEIPVPLEELQGISRLHVVAEVTGLETLDLANGPTEAVRIDLAYTPVGFQEVLANYAEMLEDAGFTLERFDVQLGLHEIIHYSDELQSVVQQRYLLRGLVDIALHGEFQGEAIDEEIFAEFNLDLNLVQTDAQLIAGPEATALEILEALGGDNVLVDNKPAFSSYDLEIVGGDDYVVGDDGLFFVAGEVPDDLTITWTLSHEDGGDLPGNGGNDGSGFIKHFEQAGLYTLTATALGADFSVLDTEVLRFAVDGFWDGDDTEYVWEENDELHYIVATGAQRMYVGVYDSLQPFSVTESPFVEDATGERHYADSYGYGQFEFDAAQLADMGTGEYRAGLEGLVSNFVYSTDFEMFIDYEWMAEQQDAPQPEEPEDPEPGFGSMLADIDRILAGLSG